MKNQNGPITTLHLQHNVVSTLYATKNLIQSHFAKEENHGFKNEYEMLKDAQASLRRIYDLVSQAYAMTRRISLTLRGERFSDEPLQEVSIQEVWKDALEILRKRYSFQDLEIIDHIPHEFPRIQCNQSELFEILYYLGQNAIQAMNRKGKLVIRANRECRSGEKPLALITISDTGPGIPEPVLTQLFEPFFTTKPLKEGNGLGLCLVKSLVKKNEGSVSVSSFEGCGTTFTLHFQVAKAKRPEIEPHLVIA